MKKEEVYRFRISEPRYRLIMIVGLYIGLILFVLAIIALAKNVEEIKTDPIIYGMEKHDFNSCTCFDQQNRAIHINLEDYQEGGG
jgi:hypothetical protein